MPVHIDLQQFELRDVLYAVNGRSGGPLKAVSVNNWLNRGQLDISEQTHEIGHGKRRKYSARDAIYIGAMNAITGLGFDALKAKSLLYYFNDRIDSIRLGLQPERGQMRIAIFRDEAGELTRLVFMERDLDGNPTDLSGLQFVTAVLHIEVDLIIHQVIGKLEEIVETEELVQKVPWTAESELADERKMLRDWKIVYAEKSLARAEIEPRVIELHGSLAAAEFAQDEDSRELMMLIGEQHRAKQCIEMYEKSVRRLMQYDEDEVSGEKD